MANLIAYIYFKLKKRLSSANISSLKRLICLCIEMKHFVFLTFFSLTFSNLSSAQAQKLCSDLFELNQRPSKENVYFTIVSESPHPLIQFPEIYNLVKRHESFEVLDFYFSPQQWRESASRFATKNFVLALETMFQEKTSTDKINAYLDFIVETNATLEVLDQLYLKSETTKKDFVNLITNPKNKNLLSPVFKMAATILQKKFSSNIRTSYSSYLRSKAFADALDLNSNVLSEISHSTDRDRIGLFVGALLERIPVFEKEFIEISRKSESERKEKIKELEQQKILVKESQLRHEKQIRSYYNKIRPLLRKEFPNDVISGQSHFSNILENAFHIYYYPGAHIMLTKILSYSWFRELRIDEKKAVYLLLLKMHNFAESSADENHRQLIKNTADFISNGYYKLYVNQTPNGENGYASDRHISLTFDVLQRLVSKIENDRDWNSKFEDQANSIVGTLAHEVSHIISGQGVETKYAYFEEEYRAFQVGFFAQHGRPPTYRESGRIALTLILNTSNAYPTIRATFVNDIGPFTWFLYPFYQNATNDVILEIKNFMLQNPYRNRHTDDLIDRLVEKIEEAPTGLQKGWSGFMYNRPKSEGQKFKQADFVSPILIEKINRLNQEPN